MATAAGSGAKGASALFSLLRSILRLHRERLPPPMRSIGDQYVVSEFRRHLKGKTTEQQWRTFAVEWQRYAAMLGGTADQLAATALAAPTQAPGAGSGSSSGMESVTAAIASGSADMTEQLLEHLSPDQRRQLIKLQQEALSLGADMLGKKGLEPPTEEEGGKP